MTTISQSTRAVRLAAAKFVFAILALLSTVFATAAVPTATLDRTRDALSLAPFTEYATDPRAEAQAEAQFAAADSGAFAPLPKGNATFGFVDGAYWFHVRLANRDHPDTHRLLVLEYALLDHVDFYVRHTDATIEHAASGDLLPFRQRGVRYRHPNFWVDVPAGSTVDLLVRVQSKSSMQAPLSLYTERAFTELERDSQLGIGIYYGILLALLFYNLILFLSLRDLNHFYYTLHVVGFGLVQLCLNGLAFEYLWPESPRFANAIVPMSMAFAMLAMHQFARIFLDLRRRWPLGNRILLALVVFHATIVVLSTFIDYRVAVLIGTAAVFPGVLAIIISAVVVAREGYRPAQLFLLAWALLLGGTSAYAMVSFGMLPKNFFTEYGMQIGSAAEMILLSFALAYRYAVLRDDNVRIAREAAGALERRVAERTRELSSAMTQLAEANERLRESSLRDGLTGVFNRRHLDTVLEPLLATCRLDQQPMSLLVADLDHFKRVNDETGHLAGDDCLRAVAKLLVEYAGERAVVARFGGEEFIVVLPGEPELAARRIAETIRQRVASTPVIADGANVRLTISIGVATAKPDEPLDAQALLRCADDALYQAKRGGRDRVETFFSSAA